MTIEIESIDYRKRVHTTQKPVQLMEYLIKTYTNEGETVLDFTMGSGTRSIQESVRTPDLCTACSIDRKAYHDLCM